jgi:hypothetical protein
MWEDTYDPTNQAFPCKVDRTSGPLAPSQQLSLINHNLNANIFPIGRGILIPDRLNSPRTNGIGSWVPVAPLMHGFGIDLTLCRILKHSAHCAPFVEDRNPNFVMLDYVNVGQGFAAVNRLNGISYWGFKAFYDLRLWLTTACDYVVIWGVFSLCEKQIIKRFLPSIWICDVEWTERLGKGEK